MLDNANAQFKRSLSFLCLCILFLVSVSFSIETYFFYSHGFSFSSSHNYIHFYLDVFIFIEIPEPKIIIRNFQLCTNNCEWPKKNEQHLKRNKRKDKGDKRREEKKEDKAKCERLYNFAFLIRLDCCAMVMVGPTEIFGYFPWFWAHFDLLGFLL